MTRSSGAQLKESETYGDSTGYDCYGRTVGYDLNRLVEGVAQLDEAGIGHSSVEGAQEGHEADLEQHTPFPPSRPILQAMRIPEGLCRAERRQSLTNGSSAKSLGRGTRGNP